MTDLLHRICSAISTAEGAFHPDPTVAPRRHNNPGNIIDPTTKQFRKFATWQEGVAWLYFQVALDIRRGLALRQLIYKWAPPPENDTENYIRETVRRTGINPDVPLWDYLTLERIP